MGFHAVPTKPCPVCGTKVKLENLERHVARVHPRAKVSVDLTPEEKRSVEATRTPGRTPSRTRERRLFLSAIVIVLVVLLAALAAQQFAKPSNTGSPAPDFTLTTVDGAPLTLSEFRGRPVLLEFMSTTCEFCQRFVDDTLVPLHRDYPSLVILSIDINREGDDLATGNARIQAFRATHNATWLYALDVTRGVSTTYSITGTPTHFVIDRDGKIHHRTDGYETYDAVLPFVTAVL